jgi:hypothetical protein
MNASDLTLDPRRADGRYMKLIGHCSGAAHIKSGNRGSASDGGRGMKSLVGGLGLTTVLVVASIGPATMAESDTMAAMAGHMVMTAIRAAGTEECA